MAEAVTPDGLGKIRQRLQHQQALGINRFTAMIVEELGRPLQPGTIGRQPRSAAPVESI